MKTGVIIQSRNDKLGRKIHQKRKKFEANFHQAGMEELRRDIYKSFSKLGIGREVLVIAQKKI